ncbi:MAG TPA: diaminopimelate decarboxylase [Deltaproteobacteria bacterium]|nr:diaminopimelate decarboxylase [Deltaproteobacteria bacterium]
MHFFDYRRGKLYAEGVSIERIVREVGTPVFIYSAKTIKRHYGAFDGAFRSVKHLVCYSVKANSNIAILRLLAREGSGFDIVSGGELFRVVKAGGDTTRVVFSGVGKRDDEIEYAIKKKILMFNVESPQELRRINHIARRLKKKTRIAIRVNPDIDPKTHPYISTGLKKNKFGIETELAIKEYIYAKDNLPWVEPIGVDCHIGSQITELSPFVEALKRVVKTINTLRKEGINIEYLNMGGGLGITYRDEAPPHPSDYGEAVIKETEGLGLTLIFEPGRVIMGNSGILVTKVLYTKKGSLKNFVIVDAAMNDLPRPSLYDAYHEVRAVVQQDREEITADIVGPICESGDFLARDRTIKTVEPGELLAFMSAGAYCFSMSSNYNSRPRSAEVLVSGRTYHVIRRRESLQDLIRGEKIPEELK